MIVVAVGLVGVGTSLLAIVVRRFVFPFVLKHQTAFAIGFGATCIGGGLPLLANAFRPARILPGAHLNPNAEQPVSELSKYAERCATRHHTAYRIQLGMVIAIAILLVAIVIWSVVLVTLNRLQYGVALGSGSVGGLVLTSAKWQPFDRTATARRDVDRADALAVGLRARLQTISAIQDPQQRQLAEWRRSKTSPSFTIAEDTNSTAVPRHSYRLASFAIVIATTSLANL
jgi:hypothetical protein